MFLLPLTFFGQDYAQSEAVIAYVEVPKVALLRTLAGLIAALWLIDWGLHSSSESNVSLSPGNLRVLPSLSLTWLKSEVLGQPRRWPLVAVGFYLGTTFLSTALSGSFRVSLWGEVPGQDSYSTYNVVVYVILFAMIATRLKTRPQVWRLLGAIVAMGVLVSGYAVLQHYGQDFLHLSESTGGYITSFMGNRIFAAAVMMMTIPVTAGAAATSLFRIPQPSDSTQSKGNQWTIRLAMLGIWVAALTIQFLGLLFTLSRGPWIGSLFALGLMIVLVAVSVGWRGFSRLALVLGLASVVTVMVFFYPSAASAAPDERTNSIPVAIDPTAADVVNRFSTISGDVLGGFSGGRLTHWKVSWGLIVDRPWFAFDSLSLRWLRPLVGYGPDLFRFTYLLNSTAEGPDRFLLAPDHAHNYFIHQTVEQGFLGTISSLGIFAAVFLAGGHQLLRTRNQMTPAHKLILIALLSVLAGRSLEMMVGVAKISDLTVLWVLLGLFTALPAAMRSPEPRRQDESPGHPPAFFPVPRVNRSLWIWKLVVVILMVGTIANLTWAKGISYPLAAVQAGRALEYFNRGDLPSTLTAIDNAIESAPDVPVYYNWRALVFSAYRRDRAGPREPHCETQTDLAYRLCLATLAHQSNINGSSQRPFEFRARIALANSAANLDQDAESIRYYQDSLDMVPGSWGLRNNMASALLHQGKPNDALKALQESLEITAGSAASLDALLLRARVYADLVRYDDALGNLDRVIEISPSNVPAHAGKAVAYAHLGQDTQAREAARRAAEMGTDREALDQAIEEIKRRR